VEVTGATKHPSHQTVHVNPMQHILMVAYKYPGSALPNSVHQLQLNRCCHSAVRERVAAQPCLERPCQRGNEM